jgi:acetylornithine deacetylase
LSDGGKGTGHLSAVSDWVEGDRRGILDLNRDLVSIPSENRCPRGDEERVQEFVEGYLGGLGHMTDKFLPTDVAGLTENPAYLGGRSYERRPNVVGKKEGVGGGGPSCSPDTWTRSR